MTHVMRFSEHINNIVSLLWKTAETLCLRLKSTLLYKIKFYGISGYPIDPELNGVHGRCIDI